jgi:hypothetical protein
MNDSDLHYIKAAARSNDRLIDKGTLSVTIEWT